MCVCVCVCVCHPPQALLCVCMCVKKILSHATLPYPLQLHSKNAKNRENVCFPFQGFAPEGASPEEKPRRVRYLSCRLARPPWMGPWSPGIPEGWEYRYTLHSATPASRKHRVAEETRASRPAIRPIPRGAENGRAQGSM